MTEKEYDLCVVGSGIAGLGAIDGYLSAKPNAKVLVLEAEQGFGGHEHTVADENSEKQFVDCGFMVYNDPTYPNMIRLFEKFGIEGKPTDMSFSCFYGKDMEGECTDTWSFGGGLAWMLNNLWRPRLYRFLSSHAKFRKAGSRVLAGKAGGVNTLGEFCKLYLKDDQEFVINWMVPFVKAIWSLPNDGDCLEYPIKPLLQFIENHGFLKDVMNLPKWKTPKHRAQSVTAAVLGDTFESTQYSVHAEKDITCKSNHRVLSITRPNADGMTTIEVQVTNQNRCSLSPENETREHAFFKARHVVLAGSGVAQAAILKAHYPERHAILDGNVHVTTHRCILHSDERYMPARKSDWTSWNVAPTHLTYWINNLQGQTGTHLFFTIPTDGFRDRKTKELVTDFCDDAVLENFENGAHYVWDTTHPCYDSNTYDAISQLMQAAAGTCIQHCGAWMRHGFHEDGLVTGRLAARALLAEDSEEDIREAGIRLPVYFPMSSNPNFCPEKLKIPLLHSLIDPTTQKPTMSFASTWHGYLFNSLCPPEGVLACDHALGHVSDETTLLQDGAIREAFAQHTGLFPTGPVLVWTYPRSIKSWAAFNPFSLYVAFDSPEQFASPMSILNGDRKPKVLATVVEVHNTPWGETFVHGLRESKVNPQGVYPYTYKCAKTMHVSPMNQVPIAEDNLNSELKTEYMFTVKSPSDIHITLFEDEKQVFRAEFNGARMEVCEGKNEKEWSPYGSVKAFIEVYAHAASRLFRGKRNFYNYDPQSQQRNLVQQETQEFEDENTLVWYSGLTNWVVTMLYFGCLYYLAYGTTTTSTKTHGGKCSSSATTGWFNEETKEDVELVGLTKYKPGACAEDNSSMQKFSFLISLFIGLVSFYFSRGYHRSGETDLLSGAGAYATGIISRFALFAMTVSFDSSMNEGMQQFMGIKYETNFLNLSMMWCLIWAFHTVFLWFLPLMRCTRGAFQCIEPVMLHCGTDLIDLAHKYYQALTADTLLQPRNISSSIGYNMTSAGKITSDLISTLDGFVYNGSKGVSTQFFNTPETHFYATVKLFLICTMFWVIIRIIISVLSECCWKSKMHHRQIGLRAVVDVGQEKISVILVGLLNIFFIVLSCLCHLDVAVAVESAVVHYCHHSKVICAVFGCYCIADLILGFQFWYPFWNRGNGPLGLLKNKLNEGGLKNSSKVKDRIKGKPLESGNKPLDAEVVSDSDVGKTETDCTTDASDIDKLESKSKTSCNTKSDGGKGTIARSCARERSSSSESESELGGAQSSIKKSGGVHSSISEIHTQLGFNVGVFVHHIAAMCISFLSIGCWHYKHEMFWLGLFEVSTPFLYLWSAYRTEKHFEDNSNHKKIDAKASTNPLMSETCEFYPSFMRFATYVMFTITFFFFRIVVGIIGMYFLMCHRIPLALAENPWLLSMSTEQLGFKISLWTTLIVGFIPLCAMSAYWMYRVFGLAKYEAIPLLEAVLNIIIGNDWLQIICDKSGGYKLAEKENAVDAESTINKTDSTQEVGSVRRPGKNLGLNTKPKYRLTFHRPWHFVHSFLTRGDVGVGESYVAGDFTMEVLGVKNVPYDHPLQVVTAHLCKLSYKNSDMANECNQAKDTSGLFASVWDLITSTFFLLLGGYSMSDFMALIMPDHAAGVKVPNINGSEEERKESIGEHYDGNQALFDSFQGETRVYTAALFSDEELTRVEKLIHASTQCKDQCKESSENNDKIKSLDSQPSTRAASSVASVSSVGATPTRTPSPGNQANLAPNQNDDQFADSKKTISWCHKLLEARRLDNLSDVMHTSPKDVEEHIKMVSDILNSAQRRKINRILYDLGGLEPRNSTNTSLTTTNALGKTNGKRGARVLDLGCGYGELVLQACRDYNVEFGLGITNSTEMGGEFQRRIETDYAGIAHLLNSARVTEGDFLNLNPCVASLRDFVKGNSNRNVLREEVKFDLITSVESIEAIHMCQYRKFASEIRKALKDDGRAVVQVIHGYGSRNPSIRRKAYQPGTTFVEVYIFPGQQLPYLEYLLDEFRAEGLVCTYVEQAGLHYAKTLRLWREKLWHATYGVGAQPTWSEKEYKKFIYYLSWCEAGFGEGLIDVARCVFVKA